MVSFAESRRLLAKTGSRKESDEIEFSNYSHSGSLSQLSDLKASTGLILPAISLP